MVTWLIIGAILYAWVLLRLIGAERQRRLEALRAALEAEALAAAERSAGRLPSA